MCDKQVRESPYAAVAALREAMRNVIKKAVREERSEPCAACERLRAEFVEALEVRREIAEELEKDGLAPLEPCVGCEHLRAQNAILIADFRFIATAVNGICECDLSGIASGGDPCVFCQIRNACRFAVTLAKECE